MIQVIKIKIEGGREGGMEGGEGGRDGGREIERERENKKLHFNLTNHKLMYSCVNTQRL